MSSCWQCGPVALRLTVNTEIPDLTGYKECLNSAFATAFLRLRAGRSDDAMVNLLFNCLICGER